MKAYEFLTESQLDEIDRRGFLKGMGAAAVGAAGVASPGKAQAKGNWKSVGVNSQGTPTFVDINSIVRKPNGEVECWIKYVAPKGSEDYLLTQPQYGWERLPTGEVGALSPIVFDVKNRMFKAPNGNNTFQRIVPDSQYDTILDIILKR